MRPGFRGYFIAGLAFALTSCHRKPPPPGPEVESFVVQDFESSVSVTKWPKDHSGEATISSEWKADGKSSLKIDPGLFAYFKDLDLDDWSAFQALRVSVHNGSDKTVTVGFELQDDHEDFYDRHQGTFGAAPGDTTAEITLSGGLWRGEENQPFRGETKTPIDLSKISRVGFTNNAKVPIYVDHLELVKIKRIETKGGFAFDFGRHGTQIMPQWIGIFDDTKFDARTGYGFVGDPPVGLSKAMSYPTPLLGDGLPLGGGEGSHPEKGSGFKVVLPGGDYQGWIAFERGGFWEDEASGYSHADLKVGGTVVHSHDFSPNGPHFFFEDVEVTDTAQMNEKLVFREAQVSRFKFKAAAGENTFTIDLKDLTGPPLRVAGLALAPDTAEGTAYIDALEEQQKKTILATFTPQDRGRRGEGRVAPAHDVVAEPIPPGDQVYPHDYPTVASGVPVPDVTSVLGQTVTVNLGVYAKRELDLKATATELGGPDKTKIDAPRISYGRYLPMRNRDVGAAWLEINHYRPEPDFHVGPDLARSVVFEFAIPEDAKPGTYVGSIKLEGGAEPLKVPIRIKVIGIKLPDLPIPVGLLGNALPFSTASMEEDAWWKLQEALLKEQGRAGLGCVTGGPGLDYRARKGGDSGYEFAGERALKYLELAKKYKMDRAVVPYSGFLPALRHTRADAEPFAKGWQKFEKDNALPPHFFYAYDEPGTGRELKEALDKMTPFTNAGLRTIGFTSVRTGDGAWDDLINATYAPALCIHDEASLKKLKEKGKHPWVYNNGLDRYGMGLGLWREIKLGVEGRLEWIGVHTQGFAFDNLDGREPSRSAWVVHDKLGILATPKWLAAREGLVDVRIRFALEAAAPSDDPVLREWTLDGYRTDSDKWPERALDTSRQKMLDRLEALQKK